MKKIKQRKVRPYPFTDVEKRDLVKRFQSAKLSGKTDKEAIKGLIVSLPTMYRWKSKSKKIVNSSTTIKEPLTTINDVIARLTDQNIGSDLEYIEALIEFIVWLRWPHSDKIHKLGVSVCVVAFLTHNRPETTINELTLIELALLAKHVHLDTLRNLYSYESLDLPIFELFPIRGQPYTEIDYFADIAWYLLAYQPLSPDSRDAASLKKAHFASQNNIFKYKWPMSEGTFRKYWHEHGAAAAFYYVDRYHPGLEFVLDPMDLEFHANIITISQNRAQLRVYLARCRTAVALMCERWTLVRCVGCVSRFFPTTCNLSRLCQLNYPKSRPLS